MDPTTRATLLTRLSDSGDASAWEQFFQIYAPLLYRFAIASGLGVADAEEVRDQCLETLASRMQDFRYDRDRGRFRGFLRKLARDAVVTHLRRTREVPRPLQALAAVADPSPSPDEQWERHFREQHLLHCVETACRRSSPRDERVLRRLLLEGARVEEVCAAFGLSAQQVYKIKSRALQRVREHMIELGADPREE